MSDTEQVAPVRVPWVVAVWRTLIGPGAAGNPPFVEYVHVFPSEEAFKAFDGTLRDRGERGRWMSVWSGDPRPSTPDWQPGDFEYAADRVYRHGAMRG